MFKQLTIKCLKLLCTVVCVVGDVVHTPACAVQIHCGSWKVYIGIKCALFDVKLSWLLNFTPCGCVLEGRNYEILVKMKRVKDAFVGLKNIRHYSLSDKVTIQVISVLSVISSLTTLITFLIIFSSNQSWKDVRDYILHWMTENNISLNVGL